MGTIKSFIFTQALIVAASAASFTDTLNAANSVQAHLDFIGSDLPGGPVVDNSSGSQLTRSVVDASNRLQEAGAPGLGAAGFHDAAFLVSAVEMKYSLAPAPAIESLGSGAPVAYLVNQTRVVPANAKPQDSLTSVPSWNIDLGSPLIVQPKKPEDFQYGADKAQDIISEPPVIILQVAGAQPPVTLNIDSGGAPGLVLDASTDLKSWSPYMNVFSRVRSIRFFDRSTNSLPSSPQFFRARSAPENVNQLRQEWQGLGYSNYKFTFKRICFCGQDVLSGTVTVNNGQVVAVTDALGAGGAPIDNPDLSQYKSIEELFDIINDAMGQVDVLMVGFDPTLHFPNQIQVDPNALMVDDEASYLASGVQLIDQPTTGMNPLPLPNVPLAGR